jgi:AraC-like DNA-binding protein
MTREPALRYSEVTVHPELTVYVRLIWMLEVDDAAAFGSHEQILPDGVVEFVIHYGTPFAMRFRGGKFSRQPQSFAISLTRRFVDITPSGRSGFVAVRFHPWGAYHFFDVPVAELSDQMSPIEFMYGQDALRLEDQVNAAVNALQRARLVQQFLLERLRRHQKERCDGLVRAVWARGGTTRVATLCRELGVTERGLQRTFAKTVGMSPKHAARLSRFLRACRLMRQGGWRSLTEVAIVAGYYDQAHCIAEFKSFSGMTPRSFLAAEQIAFSETD